MRNPKDSDIRGMGEFIFISTVWVNIMLRMRYSGLSYFVNRATKVGVSLSYYV